MPETAIEAINSAQDIGGIASALQICGKIANMLDAFKSVTGEGYFGRTVGVKKDELAYNMAQQILNMRKREAFKALPVDEKFTLIKGKHPYDAMTLIYLCREEELTEIAGMLNITVRGSNLADMRSAVIDELRIIREDTRINGMIACGADKKEVREELFQLSANMHMLMAEKAGFEIDGKMTRDVITDMLTEHYFKGSPPTPPDKPKQPKPPTQKPKINPDDTSLAEYGILQANINVSMSVRSALKNAMKLLDPKSKDYAVLDELYYCEGQDIEEYIERRRVIHKTITTLRGVRLKENNLLYMG